METEILEDRPTKLEEELARAERRYQPVLTGVSRAVLACAIAWVVIGTAGRAHAGEAGSGFAGFAGHAWRRCGGRYDGAIVVVGDSVTVTRGLVTAAGGAARVYLNWYTRMVWFGGEVLLTEPFTHDGPMGDEYRREYRGYLVSVPDSMGADGWVEGDLIWKIDVGKATDSQSHRRRGIYVIRFGYEKGGTFMDFILDERDSATYLTLRPIPGASMAGENSWVKVR